MKIVSMESLREVKVFFTIILPLKSTQLTFCAKLQMEETMMAPLRLVLFAKFCVSTKSFWSSWEVMVLLW